MGVYTYKRLAYMRVMRLIDNNPIILEDSLKDSQTTVNK